jgi:DNA-directed RNA polymerase subunit RPC12/RpoP
MDGLALFRLTRVPQKQSKKRKVNQKTEEELKSDLASVEYYCSSCGKTNLVTTVSNIQCAFCDWRILEKGRKSIVTINAV